MAVAGSKRTRTQVSPQVSMSYYSYMTPDYRKVYWIYGFEIDYDIIERVDHDRAFFATNDDYSQFDSDNDGLSDPTERVTDFLRQEYDCIAPMLGWDPDSPTKERTYVLAVHVHNTPIYYNERIKVMKRVARLKSELMPDVKAKAKWFFSCDAGVHRRDVDWNSRPRPFFGRLKPRTGSKKPSCCSTSQ